MAIRRFRTPGFRPDRASLPRLNRLFIAIACGMAVLGAAVVLGVNLAVNRAVSMDARTKAQDWANYFIDAMPELDRLLATGKLDNGQESIVATAAKVGNVFRFKLYDPKGNTVIESDPERFDKEGADDADHVDDEVLDVTGIGHTDIESWS